MLSKNKAKLITSLHQKKYRDKNNCFIAEGPKVVSDLISGGLKPLILAGTTHWKIPELKFEDTEIIEITEQELKKISTLVNPLDVIAVFEKPNNSFTEEEIGSSVSILLDNVRDPGNLGTIIRTADWFGVKHIFCSTESVDTFNPKTVQSTMGALASVTVHYTNLSLLIAQYSKPDFPVYGTFLYGESVYKVPKTPHGFIVLGSESHGISQVVANSINKKITIPQVKPNSCGSESLNLAVATGIVCSELLSQ